MDAELETWQLAAELSGHQGAARSVAAFHGPADGPADYYVVTGGNDLAARLWLIPKTGAEGDGTGLVGVQICESFDHEGPVTAVAALAPGALPEVPLGFVSGSQDGVVRAFDGSGQTVRMLVGHGGGVISLDWLTGGPAPRLVSGSWDGTARVWDVASGACLATLEGFQNGVTVCALPGGALALAATGAKGEPGATPPYTGCVVQVWAPDASGGFAPAGEVFQHSGPVRGLCPAPGGAGFVSCANDSTVVCRTMDGTPLKTLKHPLSAEGFESFVLACAAVGEQVVSGDEAGNLLVWGEGNFAGAEHPEQAVVHPSAIWKLAGTPQRDVVSACADGKVRIFTRRPLAALPEDAQRAFQAAAEAIAEQAAKALRKAAAPSAAQISNYPLWDTRYGTPGTGNGQIKVWNKDGTLIAASWDANAGSWIEQGEVTGISDGGVVNGVAYDHVYPIEVDGEGGVVHKLEIGHNDGANPFISAQKFLDDHMLPQHHLNQVAEYIMQRAGQAPNVIGGAAAAPNANPSPNPNANPNAAPALKHLPLRSFVPLPATAAQLDKMVAKLLEFDAVVPTPLGEDGRIALENIRATLANTSRYHSSKFSDAQGRVLAALLRWPAAQVFPALDITRAALAHPDGGRSLSVAFGSAAAAIAHVAGVLKANADAMPVVVTSLKALSNALCRSDIAAALASGPGFAEAFDAVAAAASAAHAHGGAGNKAIAGALGTLLLNLSALAAGTARGGSGPRVGPSDVVDRVAALTGLLLEAQVQSAKKSADGIVRALLAVGTLAQQGHAPPEASWAAAKQNAATLASALGGDAVAVWEECQAVGL